MKKLFSHFQLLLLVIFLLVGTFKALAQEQAKAEKTNYLIARWVIGSGGVLGASSANYFQHATAGQAVVGTMQGANHWLKSGFWVPRGLPTGILVDEPIVMPIEFELRQNYPNPFNPQTTIQYALPQACQVTIEIFNVVGQRIRMLCSEIQGPGLIQTVWDARDDTGERVGSGVYLCSFTASEIAGGSNNGPILYRENRKLILVK